MKLEIEPTDAEIFKAARRRDGMSQEQCAKKMKTKEVVIRYWESETIATPIIDITPIAGEIYFMIRERIGLNLKAAAALIGMSHVTLIKMEKSEEEQNVLDVFYRKYMRDNKINL